MKIYLSIKMIIIIVIFLLLMILPFIIRIELFEDGVFTYLMCNLMILFSFNYIIDFILKNDMYIKYIGIVEYSSKFKNKVFRTIILMFYLIVLFLMVFIIATYKIEN